MTYVLQHPEPVEIYKEGRAETASGGEALTKVVIADTLADITELSLTSNVEQRSETPIGVSTTDQRIFIFTEPYPAVKVGHWITRVNTGDVYQVLYLFESTFNFQLQARLKRQGD